MIQTIARYVFPIVIVTLATSCNNGDSGLLDHMVPPEAFNLTSIAVDNYSGNGTFAATFNWDKSLRATRYTVCRKDTAQPDNCESLASTSSTIHTTSIDGALKNLSSEFFVIATSDNGISTKSNELSLTSTQIFELIAYIKASNTEGSDVFGRSLALSSDGKTLAVGASNESSNAIGINGNQADNSASSSGAVYIYRYDGIYWSQQAYIKASNTEANDFFGYSVSLSSTGNALAVSAVSDDSSATGVNGDQLDNSAPSSGAVYIFRYDGSDWSQQAYIKASNTESNDSFGWNLSLSGDGDTLAVGSANEASNATGINGNQADNSQPASGAVYLYRYNGTNWFQQAYIKAANAEANDRFGDQLSISADGNVLGVVAKSEDSDATGVNGNDADNSAVESGAAYIFRYGGSSWSQEAYIKASNTQMLDNFGDSISVSGNGDTCAVGALFEDSGATGVNGDQSDNSIQGAGAVYLYRYDGSNWLQQAYIKASNPGWFDAFGESVALSTNGNVLAIGTRFEDSNATGLDGDQLNNGQSSSGAVYLFYYDGSIWQQGAYIKATNTQANDYFGERLSLSGDGETLAVSATENSNATGINGDDTDNSAANSGAVFLY